MFRRFIERLLLLLGGSLVALLLVEMGLRVSTGPDPRYFYTVDANLGGALRPGASGWLREEGEAFVRINSQGLRDREHTKEKPKNTLRVAVLGDSMVEALQVSTEKTFWAVLERELARCPSVGGATVEVINFGVSGYGTAQELLMLRHRAWDYHPDIVVLAFFSGNDVRNNSRALQQEPWAPYFLERNGELVLDDSFREDPGFRAEIHPGPMKRFRRWGWTHSRVLQVVARVIVFIRKIRGREAAEIPGKEIGGTEIGLDEAVYAEPTAAVWKDAWKVTEDLIVTMNAEVVANGARFLVVTLSTGIQVNPDRDLRQQFMKRLGVESLFYPDMRIRALGERRGIPVLNVAPVFQEYAEQHKMYLHGFRVTRNLGKGHWNEEGHRLAGDLITRKLCEEMTAPTDREAGKRGDLGTQVSPCSLQSGGVSK